MIIQEIITFLIFAAAVCYLIYFFYKQSKQDNGCGSGCGSCSAVDFKKIQDQMEAQQKK